MSGDLIVVLFSVGCATTVVVIMAWLTWEWTFGKLWRWLKGSRVSYYFESGYHGSLGLFAQNQTAKIREAGQRALLLVSGFAIEISRGPWRRPSAIYGEGPRFWTIVQDWQSNGVDWVRLEDMRGLRVKTALQMINRYPSLEALVDRIAELERELANTNYQLKESEGQRQRLRADLEVILRVLAEGRKQHSSRFSEGLRLFLESSRSYTSDLEAPGEILLDNCRDQLDTCLQRAFARKPVRA